jgi:threonine dehydrogenase-like Zn-dependent dehydrogenase
MENSNITRRRFVGASLAGVALGRMQEAAKPVTVGLIGGGIRGLELMQNALEVGAKVAIVCDLYDGHLRRANEIQPNTPTTRNYEDVLARKDLDAVMIATSDHWHAPIAIAAMRAARARTSGTCCPGPVGFRRSQRRP